jgi:GT2 family glycosyltransferase
MSELPPIGITTLVMYHPLRPVDCLVRALDSLRKATKVFQRVEVVIQGMCHHELPPPDAYAPMDLAYLWNKHNQGNSRPMAERFRHWMEVNPRRTEFWAKVDDDFVLPESGWDLLIEALESERSRGEFKIGAACLGTDKNRPQLINVSNGVFDRAPGIHAARVLRHGELEWAVADFVHNGATIYTREAFEAGCMFDAEYFVGGEHVDMWLQMHRAGFHGIATSVPKAQHLARYCTSEDYQAVRMDRQNFIRAYYRFNEKWKLRNPKLALAAGIPES